MRKTPLINDEFYHIYNRGVEQRNIFLEENDLNRFLESIRFFNTENPVGSLRDKKELLHQRSDRWEEKAQKRLVDVACYCLNPNHHHLLLRQRQERGVSEFIKRLSGGYTRFFNDKYNRNGVLFQGKFKSIHVNSNEYLLHLSVYINLNNRLGGLGDTIMALSRSSWGEYIGQDMGGFCEKGIILNQFSNIREYEKFALDSFKDMVSRKEKDEEFRRLLLE